MRAEAVMIKSLSSLVSELCMSPVGKTRLRLSCACFSFYQPVFVKLAPLAAPNSKTLLSVRFFAFTRVMNLESVQEEINI